MVRVVMVQEFGLNEVSEYNGRTGEIQKFKLKGSGDDIVTLTSSGSFNLHYTRPLLRHFQRNSSLGNRTTSVKDTSERIKTILY